MSRAVKYDVILEDVMDEIEQKFKDYLTNVDAWQYYEDVDYFFREATVPPLKDIQDIHITNYPQDDQTMPEDILDPFLQKYRQNIRNSMLVGDENICCKMVEDAVNNAINSLDNDCYEDPRAKIEKHVVTPQDIRQYSSEKKTLEKTISNKADIRILLDSYHIKKTIIGKNSVCFVTTDKEHISDNSQDIEKTLIGVHVRNPNEKPL
jgi:hypothetical protein